MDEFVNTKSIVQRARAKPIERRFGIADRIMNISAIYGSTFGPKTMDEIKDFEKEGKMLEFLETFSVPEQVEQYKPTSEEKAKFSMPNKLSDPPGKESMPENVKTENIQKRLMKDLMKDFNLQKFQAAGIVGNLTYETAFFEKMQEEKPIRGEGGYGYAHWTGGRRDHFEKWSEENNLDKNSYEANYGYLKLEFTKRIKESGLDGMGISSMKKLKDTENIEQATNVILKNFLRPLNPESSYRRRLNIAKVLFDYTLGKAG